MNVILELVVYALNTKQFEPRAGKWRVYERSCQNVKWWEVQTCLYLRNNMLYFPIFKILTFNKILVMKNLFNLWTCNDKDTMELVMFVTCLLIGDWFLFVYMNWFKYEFIHLIERKYSNLMKNAEVSYT